MAGVSHGDDTVIADDGTELAVHLAELTRGLAGEQTVVEVVRLIVEAAVREVPGAELAGVTVINRRGASTPASTDELVERIDELQYETKQGPCLEAAGSSRVVRSQDLGDDPRWPKFAQAATELGVRAMLSFPLFVEAGTIGALNLYARQPVAFNEESERIGFLLAAHAAAAMVVTRQSANLRVALDSRDLIGQAKGILMERFKITGSQAFDLLIRASQHTNMPLHEVARQLAETGEFVDRPGRTRS